MNLWRRVDEAGDRVALTFDDCDREAEWEGILDVLREHHAPATFFPSGMRVEQFPALARRTVREGHAVGSHGWDHARLTGLPFEAVRRRLVADRDTWRRLAGVTELGCFRPPYGVFDGATVAAAAAAGYSDVVLWDVDPLDWTEPGPSVIEARVLREIRSGSIVELHVIGQTLTALPGLLDGLRDRGLRPVALPDLLGSRRLPGHPAGR